jgi:hypothetical protein
MQTHTKTTTPAQLLTQLEDVMQVVSETLWVSTGYHHWFQYALLQLRKRIAKGSLHPDTPYTYNTASDAEAIKAAHAQLVASNLAHTAAAEQLSQLLKREVL